MSTRLEFLGISRRPERRAGVRAREGGRRGAGGETRHEPGALRPAASAIVTREAIENAVASVAATAGRPTACCTCWRSPGSSACRSRSTRSGDRWTHAGGRGPRAGGASSPRTVRGRRRRADRSRAPQAGLVHGEAPNVDGRTLAEIAPRRAKTAGQEWWCRSRRRSRRRGFLVLRGNLAPDGCVVKLAGHAGASTGAGAVFDSEEAASRRSRPRRSRRRRGGDPLRGPGRRPRHARDAPRHRASSRRARRVGGPHHRRPLLRGEPRAHGRPRLPRGRVGARSRPCRTGTRSRSTSTPASCVGPHRPGARRPPERLDAAPPRYRGGVFAKYAALVSSASEGAVTRSTSGGCRRAWRADDGAPSPHRSRCDRPRAAAMPARRQRPGRGQRIARPSRDAAGELRIPGYQPQGR